MIFIEHSYAISPQKTFDETCFTETELIFSNDNKLKVVEPNYNEGIPPNVLRRMGRAVRLGVGGAIQLLRNKNLNPDAIVFSSAVGGLEDCIKFLDQIYTYKEASLTPTNFVQSTPNAIAGSLALLTQNTAYNMTYVNGANSFLDALLDIHLLINEGSIKNGLLGSVEEISSYNYNINQMAGWYKNEPIHSLDLISSNTKGTICGEGSCLFYLSQESANYEAEIIDFHQVQREMNEEECKKTIQKLLEKNKLKYQDIGSLVLGFSGDKNSDDIYHQLTSTFENANVYGYKHLVGEYPTSVSFALWLGIKILQNKILAKSVIIQQNQLNSDYLFIYNHYQSTEHAFLLIKKGNKIN